MLLDTKFFTAGKGTLTTLAMTFSLSDLLLHLLQKVEKPHGEQS